MDFLTNRPQRGRIGALVSSQLPLSAGAPQGCVLSSLLYSLSITAVPPPTLPTPSSGMRTTQPLFVPSQGGGGGPQTGGVVQGQQPHPEHLQVKGNNHEAFLHRQASSVAVWHARQFHCLACVKPRRSRISWFTGECGAAHGE